MYLEMLLEGDATLALKMYSGCYRYSEYLIDQDLRYTPSDFE